LRGAGWTTISRLNPRGSKALERGREICQPHGSESFSFLLRASARGTAARAGCSRGLPDSGAEPFSIGRGRSVRVHCGYVSGQDRRPAVNPRLRNLGHGPPGRSLTVRHPSLRRRPESRP
jgi:hypothetical protein